MDEPLVLTEEERALGATTLILLREPRAWARRRVEHVNLEDPATFKRQVSVDFTIPPVWTPLVSPEPLPDDTALGAEGDSDDEPPSSGTGQPASAEFGEPASSATGEPSFERWPLYLMPLALLRKGGPLRHFTLSDESGKRLSLVTRGYNSRIAAATLSQLASETVVKLDPDEAGDPPDAIEQLIWKVASQDRDAAVMTWEKLDRTLLDPPASPKAEPGNEPEAGVPAGATTGDQRPAGLPAPPRGAPSSGPNADESANAPIDHEGPADPPAPPRGAPSSQPQADEPANPPATGGDERAVPRVADDGVQPAASGGNAGGAAGDAELDRARKWLAYLDEDGDFIRLAGDFARNFILLVPVRGRPGDRHIIKYSYEQTRNPPLTRLPPWLDKLRDWWLRRVQGKRTARGVIELQKQRLTDDWKRRVGVLAGIRPLSVDFDVPAATLGSSYHLDVEAPAGLQITRARLQTCAPLPDREERKEEQRSLWRRMWPWRQSADPSQRPTPDDAEHGNARRRRRPWSRRSPERADGASQGSSEGGDPPREGYVDAYVDKLGVSRAHVYIRTVPRDHLVRAVVDLRPLTETAIRAATVSAAASFALLLVAAIGSDELGGNFGATSALLLTVPVALAAWGARVGESRTTASLVFGIRTLAFLAGLNSLLGLIVIALTRGSCVTETTQVAPPVQAPGETPRLVETAAQACDAWGGVWIVLALLAAGTGVILIALLRAMTFASRPPERRGATDHAPV